MDQDELFPHGEYKPSVSLLKCEGLPEVVIFVNGMLLGSCPGRRELFAWFDTLEPGRFEFNWQHVTQEELGYGPKEPTKTE